MGYKTATALSSAQAVAAAQNFDVIVGMGNQFTPFLADMRAANSNLRIYTYVNGLYSNPTDSYPASAYSYDTSGNKIRTYQFSNWLMDPTSPEWQSALITHCQQLNGNSGYDGCFLDNLGQGPFVASYVTAPPVNVATNQVWVASEWMAATSQLAKNVTSAVPGWLVSGNGLGSGPRYLDPIAPTKPLISATTAAMAELFLRGPTSSITLFPSEANWLKNVQMLSDAEASGGSVLATTKVWLTATAAEIDQWHTYALATFLLGSSGGSYFNFSSSQDFDALTATRKQDKVAVGTPRAAFAKTNGVYQRSFTNGLVLVNPTKATVTVALAVPYKDANGAWVNSVTLPINSAAILTLT